MSTIMSNLDEGVLLLLGLCTIISVLSFSALVVFSAFSGKRYWEIDPVAKLFAKIIKKYKRKN